MINTIEELQAALNNLSEFKRLVPENSDFLKLLRKFPDQAEEIIDQLMLKNPDLLEKQYIGENYYTLLDITRICPRRVDVLINRMADSVFMHMTSSSDYLLLVKDDFPDHAEEIAEKVLSSFGTSTPFTSFKRYFLDGDELIKIIQAFPKHGNNLITQVLSDSDLFKEMCFSTNNLQELSELFPEHYQIFSQPTVEAALQEIAFKKIKNLVLNATNLPYTRGAVLSFFSQTFFSALPSDVLGYLPNFFTRRDGGRIACVNMTTRNGAVQEEEIQSKKDELKNLTPKLTKF